MSGSRGLCMFNGSMVVAQPMTARSVLLAKAEVGG